VPENSNFINETSIDSLYVIQRPRFDDVRGFFSEIFRLNDLEELLGKPLVFKQASHSFSNYKVFRGFHAEECNKLVYIITGSVKCVFVDIRDPGFLKTEVIDLEASECKAIFIPEGVANSYVVTSKDPVNYMYFTDEYYKGPSKRAFIWNDTDVNIKWPFKEMIISEADKKNPTLRSLFPEKFK
jgi:dTDP-4-dehydrorhamnose 3,5-epimerase